LLVALCAIELQAAPKLEEVYPATPDPLVGEYVGRWSEAEEVNPEVAAQVVALGGNRYRVRIVNKLDMRCPVLGQAEVEPKGGVLQFEDQSLHGTCDGQTIIGGRGTGKLTFSMRKVTRESPTVGKTPPPGAVVLFNGSNLDAWQTPKGWRILEDGTLLVTPDGEDLVTNEAWNDIELHVEFRTPLMAASRGQQRGNSGVFVQDVYEVQVLDSFGLEGYYDECGALYKLSAPHVNACYPPLAWQTFDVVYTAPRYDASGRLAAYGRVTVHHNGVLIHNDQELTWITAWKEKERVASPPRDPGHVKLQAHDNFVQFRNIWLVDKSKSR
jgi:hypothetical protein